MQGLTEIESSGTLPAVALYLSQPASRSQGMAEGCLQARPSSTTASSHKAPGFALFMLKTFSKSVEAEHWGKLGRSKDEQEVVPPRLLV